MFDAKPPKEATRPGGNALAFDWQLISDTSWTKPWILAGGLTPQNVADAIAVSGATAVDVSSGVEDAPGVKSPENIRDFHRRGERRLNSNGALVVGVAPTASEISIIWRLRFWFDEDAFLTLKRLTPLRHRLDCRFPHCRSRIPQALAAYAGHK